MKSVLLISFIIAVASYLVLPESDPDLWWHIVAGRWIIANGNVPHSDLWTLFGTGLPWRAYSWSSEIVVAFAERLMGLQGLVLVKALLALGIVGTFTYVFSKLSGKIFVGVFLATFASAALVGHFTLRPQSLTWILFVLILWSATCFEKNANTVNLKPHLWIALYFCIWANTHLSAILPLGAIVFWLMFGIKPINKKIAVGVLAALAGTLLTPYLGGEWLTFFSKTSHPALFSRIVEFGPATILQSHTTFLLISLAALTWVVIENPKALSGGKLLGSAAFAFLGLAIVKFIPLAIIYNCVAIAYGYSTLGESRIKESLNRLEGLIDRIPKEGLSFLLMCSAIVMVYGTWQTPLGQRIPVKTLKFVIAKQLPPPFLNTFNDGGYISYRFANAAGEPGVKVSIDGRTNLISPDVWKQYSDTLFGNENWQVFINRVAPNTIIWNQSSPLIALLKQSGEWQEVFRENTGEDAVVTFTRKSLVAPAS